MQTRGETQSENLKVNKIRLLLLAPTIALKHKKIRGKAQREKLEQNKNECDCFYTLLKHEYIYIYYTPIQ